MDNISQFSYAEQDRPVLVAELLGGEEFPDIKGEVYVYFLPDGIYLQSDFEHLPPTSEFAFHVHEGLLCEAAGDKLLPLPDLFSDKDGVSSAQLYLDRVNSTQIAGKPIMLHLKRDGEEIDIACSILSRIL